MTMTMDETKKDEMAALCTELRDVELARDHALLQVERLIAMVRDLESAAVPNERDHPTMYPVWERARALLAGAMVPHETTASIAAWQRATFGIGTARSYVDRAAKELRELRAIVRIDSSNPDACAEVADVVILLSHILHLHGRDLATEVDAKMRINRARTWRIASPGHGQHVETSDPPDDELRAAEYIAWTWALLGDMDVYFDGIGRFAEAESGWPWDPTRPVAGQYEEWLANSPVAEIRAVLCLAGEKS